MDQFTDIYYSFFSTTTTNGTKKNKLYAQSIQIIVEYIPNELQNLPVP